MYNLQNNVCLAHEESNLVLFLFIASKLLSYCLYYCSDYMCQSLIKFSGKKLKVLEIKTLRPYYHFFTDLCLEKITKLLSYGLEQLTFRRYNISDSSFDELNAAIASSQLKRLNYDNYLTIEKAKSLARLLTQTATLDKVSVGHCGWTSIGLEHGISCDINVVKILVDAMKHSRVNKLHLRVDVNCSQVFLILEPRLTFGCYL